MGGGAIQEMNGTRGIREHLRKSRDAGHPARPESRSQSRAVSNALLVEMSLPTSWCIGLLSAVNWNFEKLLFTEHIGLVLIYIGLALMTLGVFVIRKIIDVKV